MEGTVWVVMRNEEARRCFLGVFGSEARAQAWVEGDIFDMNGVYDEGDYDVIEAEVGN